MNKWTIAALVVAAALSATACEEESIPSLPPPTEAVTEVATAETETPTQAPSPTPTTPARPEPTPTQAPSPLTYTVKAGDVCWRVAEEHGVTTKALMEANPRIDANCSNLGVGWELVIPGASAAGAVASPSPEVTSASTPESTPRATPRRASTPAATAAAEGYWHEHCARIRNDGGCDRRFRPIYYERHYHPASYPRHSEGEHEID
ncbi:MAG: LysM peptidoglycan-binding domain-containing protein [Dehalococcoidia bacterium]|nr:LysM peptidoglycan-binding domain-containing protein [Dehalococcoidia bacterium]